MFNTVFRVTLVLVPPGTLGNRCQTQKQLLDWSSDMPIVANLQIFLTACKILNQQNSNLQPAFCTSRIGTAKDFGKNLFSKYFHLSLM